jgi:hypothetical protein
MRDLVQDVLFSKAARESGIFDQTEVQNLVNQSLRCRQGGEKGSLWDPQAKKVWSLIVFELWRQRFAVSTIAGATN